MTSGNRHRFRATRRPGVAFAVLLGGLLATAPAFADPVQSAGQNRIEASGDRSQGVIELNQDAGAFNNQGNVLVVATTSAEASAALAKVSADVAQVELSGASDAALQSNAISDSFNDTTGLVQVNQTTGRGNAQLNIVALAFASSAEFSPAMTDVELKGVAGPAADAGAASAAAGSSNTIENSFNNFKGVAQVQQIAGDRNVVVNVVAIALGGAGG